MDTTHANGGTHSALPTITTSLADFVIKPNVANVENEPTGLKVICRKLTKLDFVMVHPTLKLGPVALVTPDREMYMLSSKVVGTVEEAQLTYAVLRLAVSRKGETLIVPERIGTDGWASSFSDAITKAESIWAMIVSRSEGQGKGHYDAIPAARQTEPPVWPEQTMEELVTMAFGPRLIRRPDHPVLRALRGE